MDCVFYNVSYALFLKMSSKGKIKTGAFHLLSHIAVTKTYIKHNLS